jgi:hypothetical protein
MYRTKIKELLKQFQTFLSKIQIDKSHSYFTRQLQSRRMDDEFTFVCNKLNMNTKILTQIRQELINNIDKEASASLDRFFKEGETAQCYGLKMAEVHKIAKTGFTQIKEYPKAFIFKLCEELWKSGYLEERVIACKWSESNSSI